MIGGADRSGVHASETVSLATRLEADVRVQLSPTFTLDVAVRIPAGITILFGPSGSGKSTLLHCLAGLRTPDGGVIRLGDRLVFDASQGLNVPASRRRVGYVFQQLALFPHMSVEDNLGYGLARLPRPAARERIERIAASFRIAHLLSRRPAAISGGERQRTALARALVTDPDLLLLDEPLSALDHRTQSLIIDDLRQWNQQRQIPIVYVTHAHREAFALGERALVLDGGRIVASGTPQQVLDTPASELLAQLAGFENFFDGEIHALMPEAGTMLCRLAGTLDLEVPWLAHAAPGGRLRLAIRAGDILVATVPPRGLSARNVIPGVIRAIRHAGPTVAIDVAAGAADEAGPLFEAHVTPHACQALALEPGAAVWLVMKTHSCHPVALTANHANGDPRVAPTSS